MASSSQTKKVIAAGAILALAGVIIVTTQGGSDSKLANQSWYYDLDSGRLFAAAAGQLPPVDAPSGPGRGVTAHVYSCGSCDEAGRQIAYLESMTERGRALMMDPDLPRQPGEELQAQQVALPPAEGEAIAWVSAAAPQGAAIQSRAAEMCAGAQAKPCAP